MKRTKFITFLGLLGFTEVAILVISGVLKIFTGIEFSTISTENLIPVKGLENVTGLDKAFNNLNIAFDSKLDYANKIIENSILLGIISIVSAIVCFIGISWMWNLQRKGFIFYLIGQLIPVVTLIVIVGFSFSFLWIFSLIFIGLWGYNLKYMS